MTTAADLLAAAATCMICGQPHPERQIKGLGRVFRTRELCGHQPRPLDPAVLASLRGLAAKLERPYPGAAAWFDATERVANHDDVARSEPYPAVASETCSCLSPPATTADATATRPGGTSDARAAGAARAHADAAPGEAAASPPRPAAAGDPSPKRKPATGDAASPSPAKTPRARPTKAGAAPRTRLPRGA